MPSTMPYSVPFMKYVISFLISCSSLLVSDRSASCEAISFLTVNGTNLTYKGEKVFLSGMNQAWVNYAEDFGHQNYNLSRPVLLKTLDNIQLAGGNSIRLWLHVDGSSTPTFDVNGYVTGIDDNLISDLKDFLAQARARNIMVNLVLWNGALSPTPRLSGLIWEERKLQTYIYNALVPMVNALRDEPSLGIWEIINEPEGCVRVGEVSDQPCLDTTSLTFLDFADWTNSAIPLQRLLIFIGRQADAIHSVDSKALVTVGAWTYKTVASSLGRRNFYSDHCLRTASNRPRANLDLYTIHTYDLLHVYWPNDPFLVNRTRYEVDKPVIIGEFSQAKGGGMTSQQQFSWSYYHGYSGAWSWCAKSGDSASDDLATQMRGMNTLKDKNDQSAGGRVNINLNGTVTARWSSGQRSRLPTLKSNVLRFVKPPSLYR